MEHLLELLEAARKVAEQAEVFWISSRETPVHFEANELKQIQTKESASVALRIFREGRVGFATSSGSVDAETLIRMAVETSQFGPPAKFQFPAAGDYPEVSIFDPEVEGVSMEAMVEIGRELIARVKGFAPGILCDAEVDKGTSSVHIFNSQGGDTGYNKSFFGVGLTGILIHGTDMLFVGDSENSCRLFTSIDGLASRVMGQLELARAKAAVASKVLPVIFTPRGVASAFLGPLELAFNGKTVLEGASRLKGRLGEQVFDKRFSLWDDATIAYGVGSSPHDDEGVPSRRVPLVAHGVISNFLYDLQTAALAGTQSTGNGRRVGGGQIRPATSSLIISEGEVAFEDMVRDTKEGLVVEQLIGAEQGNLLSGDFGGNVLLGYKVENGKIVGRVKDTMISGNVYQVLKESPGIGREARWVDGILRTPPLYCPRISVSTKGS